MGVWWKYLQDQFDFNNQLNRRIVDILTHDTFGPLLRENNIPDCNVARTVCQLGGSAALDQALHDLFGKKLKDVWNDFCVSSTMLRNNTSIPAKWRNYFPYWIYNTQYAGFDELVAATATLIDPATSDFWERLDKNLPIPASYGLGTFTGQTLVPALPTHFESNARAFSSYSFNVPQTGRSTISVTAPLGEWKITLVQFTSDGTSQGSFIADGPHDLSSNDTYVFNIANHNPPFTQTGNIRLICTNTTFNSTGTLLSDYFQTETDNARIVIDAPVTALVEETENALALVP
jgi:hypothetical protein